MSHAAHNDHNAPPPPEMTGRRGFLRWVTHGLGAMFGVVLAAPAIAYLIDPRHRNPPDAEWTDVASIDELSLNVPKPFPVRKTRRDAWTLSPNEIVGRVYLIKKGEPTADGKPNVEALSTTCPHKGCTVNYMKDDRESPFQCPCHEGKFSMKGELISGPMDGGTMMYSFPTQFKPGSNNKIVQVEYKNV